MSASRQTVSQSRGPAMLMRTTVIGCAVTVLHLASPAAVQRPVTTAFTGFTLIDGTGAPPVTGAVLVIRDGRVVAAAQASRVRVPDDARRIDLSGRVLMPGLVNAHGHAGSTVGLESRPEGYTEANVRRQLGVYARYGVTTVVSLGDDRE